MFDAVETPVGISSYDGAQVAYIAHAFNSPLPATFPAPNSYTGHAFHFYLIGETTTLASEHLAWHTNGGTQEGYNTWRVHFGQASSGGTGLPVTNSAVPEPSGLAVLILTAPALLRRRRWRR